MSEKFDLGLDFPNLPYLIDGDVKLSESKSIMKYLCKKHRPALLGRNAEEVAMAEAAKYQKKIDDDIPETKPDKDVRPGVHTESPKVVCESMCEREAENIPIAESCRG